MHVPRRRRKHFGWETFTRIKNDIYIHVYTYKRRIIPVLVRLRYSCWGTRVASVGHLPFSFHWTGGTPRCAKNFTLRFRQTPPVGRSEKARRHSPELQWSPNTKHLRLTLSLAWQAKPNLKTINFSEKRFSGKVTQLSIIQFFLCQVVLT